MNGKFYNLMLRLDFGTCQTVDYYLFFVICLVLSADNKDEVAMTAFD